MFAAEYRSRVDLLLDILGIIKWDSCFALKGGTAINFFYTDVPRLSVDIDLVYLPTKPRAEAFAQMIAEFKGYIEHLNRIGLQAIHSNTSSANPVGKVTVIRGQARVIIEPNIIVRGTVLECQLRELSLSVVKIFGKEVTVKCLSKKEIYAGKLLAMLDRQHPRDIFDMMIYRETGGTIAELLDVFIIYLLQTNRPFHELLSPNLLEIKSAYENAFAGMTTQPISLEKLQETRILIFDEVNNKLTSEHLIFLRSCLEGKPLWSLLPFENIATLPGIQWKMQNILQMSFAKKAEQIKALNDFPIL